MEPTNDKDSSFEFDFNISCSEFKSSFARSLFLNKARENLKKSEVDQQQLSSGVSEGDEEDDDRETTKTKDKGKELKVSKRKERAQNMNEEEEDETYGTGDDEQYQQHQQKQKQKQQQQQQHQSRRSTNDPFVEILRKPKEQRTKSFAVETTEEVNVTIRGASQRNHLAERRTPHRRNIWPDDNEEVSSKISKKEEKSRK